MPSYYGIVSPINNEGGVVLEKVERITNCAAFATKEVLCQKLGLDPSIDDVDMAAALKEKGLELFQSVESKTHNIRW
jgi:hypothetical protein